LRKAIFFIEKYILQLGLKEHIESMIHHMHDRVPTHIQALAEQRRQAKLAKDYATADTLRSQLHTAGREMLDTKENYKLVKYNNYIDKSK
jgi:cysteinyl-tRNA synthetase